MNKRLSEQTQIHEMEKDLADLQQQLADQRAVMQGLVGALKNFVACACLYYHSHSLNEFAKPIKQARASLYQARKSGLIK